MLFDLATEPPVTGSLLESLFLLLVKKRSEQELFRTKLLVQATLAPHLEENKVSETWTDYFNSMFPYLQKDRVRTEVARKKALEQWTNRGPLKVKAIGKYVEKTARIKSALERGRKSVEDKEKKRREGKLRRIS